MSEQHYSQAQVKKSKRISMVWFIPILALVLGAWLVYKNIQEQGPLIKISFETADGLEAGKTLIKYKDVQLGLVEAIELKPDLSGVVITARVNKEMAPYLNDQAKFWVVRPRVGLAGISGLGTLLSGAYIGIDSTLGGKRVSEFVGLEQPPARDHSVGGTTVSLIADQPGDLSQGSPVYYKQFPVGEIDSVELAEDFSEVYIKAFIESPYDKLINHKSNFWNVSGVTAELNSDGVSIQMQALESLLVGGIAFDSPTVRNTNEVNLAEKVFRLYASESDIGQKVYTEKEYYILNFDQSIRGLSVGATVDYRGIKVGRVASIDVQYHESSQDIFIPVLIEIELGRLGLSRRDVQAAGVTRLEQFQEFLDEGFRAKLQTGNILTGQLFVSLDLVEDAEPVTAQFFNGYPQIPTIPTDLGEITHNFNDLLKKFNELEIEQLLADVDKTVVQLNELLADTDQQVVSVLTGATRTLKSLDGTLIEAKSLIKGFDEDSITRYEMNVMLKEIQEAARSVRTLVETLEENPSSVIFGKSRSNDAQ